MISKFSRNLMYLSVAFGASMGAAISHAQGDSQLEEVLVSGFRESLANSLNQKRESTGFVDAISAEDLGKFPDQNISESLQRVPGVTLFRGNTGEGQSINLRGLGSEFTRVEINGVTGTGNGSSGRFGGDFGSVGGGFNFEILASELFDNVSISKSATAKQTEGGLAGLVELSTPNAFDRDGFNATGSVQAQSSETADDVSPRAALLISQNWDDTFGLTASVAYSEASYKSDSSGGISARPLSASATTGLKATATSEQLAALVPQTINYQVDIEDRETLGVTTGIQWAPSEKITLSVDGIMGNIKSDRFFTRADAPPESSLSFLSNPVVVDGVMQSGTVGNVQQRVGVNDLSGEENFSQVSAKVDYYPTDEWTISPMIALSKRDTERAGQLLSFAKGDRATGQLTTKPVTYSISGSFIDWSTEGVDFSQAELADDFMLNVFMIRPTEDRDEEVSGKVDFSKSFDGSALTKIDFGVRTSNRETSRKSFEVRIDDVAGTNLTTLPTLADALVVNKFDIDGAPSSYPGAIISANPRKVIDLYAPNGIDYGQYLAKPGPVDNLDITGITLPGTRLLVLQQNAANRTFSGEEETVAAYGEVTFQFERVLLNFGGRYVETTQTSTGYSVNSSTRIAEQIANENTYSEFLPSVSLRFDAAEDVLLRAAYSKTLTRPTLFDMRISESYSGIDATGGTGSRGNPNLQPFTSDNIDVGFEWYFTDEALLAANYFHKSIDGLIVAGSATESRTYLSQVTGEEVTAPIVFNIPVNGSETSTIEGVEFMLQTPFSFLPDMFSSFGGILNYTYTDGGASVNEKTGVADGVAFPGLSGSSYNAILYYDNGILDARISYAWREKFLETNSGSFGVPVWQKDFGQLDFSANYAITDYLNIQFQMLNLTNERLELVSISDIPHTITQLDRRAYVGVRYKF